MAKGGAFEFDDVKPATYGIRVEPPRGLVDTGVARTVEIPDPRACARERYFLQRAGRITGRVVGPDGHPAAMLRIDAARGPLADEFPVESSVTRSDGTFEFADLPAGRYIVGINLRNAPPSRGSHARMIYPARGPGHTIAVGDRAIDIGDWKLVLPIR